MKNVVSELKKKKLASNSFRIAKWQNFIPPRGRSRTPSVEVENARVICNSKKSMSPAVWEQQPKDYQKKVIKKLVKWPKKKKKKLG